ncbi:FadR/GntR family transcriptional regulator [Pseudoduganella sp. UC29_106]|uniref:FadR/GntR family transcriptional regulator n=1 Tax=Pseudoduganella sp. UC29_106 TaxID=3374553 RepID=UPI00375765B1
MDNHQPPPHTKPRNLAHAVVSYVSELIRDGRITPGQKVPSEAEIIQALGVSRSVVREAMSQLQATGAVETRQGKGTFVLDRSAQPMGLQAPADMRQHDVLSILELRISLETEAAGLAARRRNAAQLARIRAALDAFLAQCDTNADNAASDTEFHSLHCPGRGQYLPVRCSEPPQQRAAAARPQRVQAPATRYPRGLHRARAPRA